MFFWFAASPLWWLLGLPASTAFATPGGFNFNPSIFLLQPGVETFVAMAVLLAGAGLIGRRALNY
jgi:hypothetical protein